MNIKTETCEFVAVSTLIPENWVKSEFWSVVSENAPFSWGDNNRSLVTANNFLTHMIKSMNVETPEPGEPLAESSLEELINHDEYLKTVKKFGSLKETYVDLEN